MTNFDWKKVNLKNHTIPNGVLGGFSLNTSREFAYLERKGVVAASLWCNGWWIDSGNVDCIRDAIACIDRIADYLSMQGAK